MAKPYDNNSYVIVEAGDNLWNIAKQFLGDPMKYKQIASIPENNIKNPDLIYQAAKRYGDQCVVLSADVKRVDGVFRVFAKGGRENTGMEAIEWIKRGVDNGAGEIVLNSIDTDGV